jgi:hypothetical protein
VKDPIFQPSFPPRLEWTPCPACGLYLARRLSASVESSPPNLALPGETTAVDPEKPESSAPAPPSTEFDSSAQAGTEPEPAAGQDRLDAQTLVDRMVAAGEWPEPALLEKIIDAGDPAVAPLISVLRTYPRGWPEEAPLDHAMGLLSILRPPAAVPELIEIISKTTLRIPRRSIASAHRTCTAKSSSWSTTWPPWPIPALAT